MRAICPQSLGGRSCCEAVCRCNVMAGWNRPQTLCVASSRPPSACAARPRTETRRPPRRADWAESASVRVSHPFSSCRCDARAAQTAVAVCRHRVTYPVCSPDRDGRRVTQLIVGRSLAPRSASRGRVDAVAIGARSVSGVRQSVSGAHLCRNMSRVASKSRPGV